MKKTIFLLRLIFLFFISHNHANAIIEKIDCVNEQEYRYGKLFHDGHQYDTESIYLSKNSFEEIKKINNHDTSINNQAFTDNYKNPKVNINGEVSENHVIVFISLTNTSKKKMVIPKKNMSSDGWLAGSIFSIKYKCVSLDYLGPLVNFGSIYTYPDDYIIIAPGETFHDRVFLDEYYHFIPGKLDYEIEVLAIPFSFSPELTRNKTTTLKSNLIKLNINSIYLNKKIRGNYCSGDKCNAKEIRWVN